LVLEHAGHAVDASIAPQSEEGRVILNRIVSANLPSHEQSSLLEWLDTVTEPRVERYWQLLSLIHGQVPANPSVPAFQWLAEAVNAHR
jgi:hypothetical protein